MTQPYVLSHSVKKKYVWDASSEFIDPDQDHIKISLVSVTLKVFQESYSDMTQSRDVVFG